MTEETLPRRERMFNIPAVVPILCAGLLAIQGLGALMTAEAYGRLLIRFAFVPGRFTFAFDPDRVSTAFNQIARDDEVRAQIAAAFLGDGTAQWWTVVTYAFLHGGWLHVGLNCLWLVAFGSAVAKRIDVSRFLALLLVCTVAGALAHYIAHPADLEPVVGASAAVSGTMGAAVRFMFQPMPGSFSGMQERSPVLGLRDTLTDRRCLTFIAIWFASNFLFGVSGAMPGVGDAPIAWEAHVGGFLAGLLIYGLFDHPAQPGARRSAAGEPGETRPPADGVA